jgi:small subunit ribosomal protein S12
MAINNVRKTLINRKKSRLNSLVFRNKFYKRKQKSSPLGKANHALGVVVKKFFLGAKQPNSGKRKCVMIQLIKNNKKVSVYLPGNLANSYVEEHDQVLIEGIGGSKTRAFGDLARIKYRVLKVNDIALKQLVKRKVEKKKR